MHVVQIATPTLQSLNHLNFTFIVFILALLAVYRYRKFLRSKDLSVQKEEDLECVLGTKKRKNMAAVTEAEQVTLAVYVCVYVCVAL